METYEIKAEFKKMLSDSEYLRTHTTDHANRLRALLMDAARIASFIPSDGSNICLHDLQTTINKELSSYERSKTKDNHYDVLKQFQIGLKMCIGADD